MQEPVQGTSRHFPNLWCFKGIWQRPSIVGYGFWPGQQRTSQEWQQRSQRQDEQ
jgi:hypothetical protein